MLRHLVEEFAVTTTLCEIDYWFTSCPADLLLNT